ncbi:MAG: aspartate/glutamate racemase family protein [Spirochaetales bacterium]|nr:aspartate/glutamate racemase family protein [Spirochaetales bacterium]
MEKTLIIGGGVGPAAGLILHRLVIDNTKARQDQDFLKTIHMSFSADIPDRTDSLKAGRPDLPAMGMAASIRAAYSVCRDLNQPAVAGIACNTFHAGSIWNLFLEKLEADPLSGPAETGAPGLTILNMIDETLQSVSESLRPGASIGILSTEGTSAERIYSDPLKEAGFTVLEPDGQKRTHEIIYNREWGLKAHPEVTPEAGNALKQEARALAGLGAELIILACTELPLVLPEKTFRGIPLLNPMEVLARALVNEAAPEKLLKVRL